MAVTSTANTPPACPTCVSPSQTLAAIAYVLRRLTHDGNFSVTGAMSDAACLHCDSDKNLLDILLQETVDYAVHKGVSITVLGALQNSKCLDCVDPKTVKAIIVRELMNAVNSVFA